MDVDSTAVLALWTATVVVPFGVLRNVLDGGNATPRVNVCRGGGGLLRVYCRCCMCRRVFTGAGSGRHRSATGGARPGSADGRAANRTSAERARGINVRRDAVAVAGCGSGASCEPVRGCDRFLCATGGARRGRRRQAAPRARAGRPRGVDEPVGARCDV